MQVQHVLTCQHANANTVSRKVVSDTFGEGTVFTAICLYVSRITRKVVGGFFTKFEKQEDYGPQKR